MKMAARQNQEAAQDTDLVFHPKRILLFLILAGLTMLFLALSAAYVYTRSQAKLPPLQIPWLFYLNTLILLASSYTVWQGKKAYLGDDTAGYQRSLLHTIILSLIFLLSQTLAWYSLFRQEIYMQTDNAAGYLYVISILHFLHVVAGLPFLLVFSVQARRYMVEPVSVLVYFSDPYKRLNLQLISTYWHFLDALWLYLILFFLANSILA